MPRWTSSSNRSWHVGAAVAAEHDAVDWFEAAAIGRGMVRPGPRITREQGTELVASLRQAAADAVEPILATTQMAPADPAHSLQDSEVLILDRATWISSVARTMRATTESVEMPALKADDLARTAVHAQAGGVLAFMATKVLGQFDPFSAERGRLMIIAPNLKTLIDDSGGDDRLGLWVCLHEQTHALQFAAAPWLREYLLEQITDMVGETISNSSPSRALTQLWDVIKVLYRAYRGQEGPGIVDVTMAPEQRERLAAITTVMSILEGHADVMMDAVDDSVVPDTASLRKKFEQRRGGLSGRERVIRSVFGLDTKLAQYRDGADFVRSVIDRSDLETFNQVWAGRESLPTADEFASPEQWIARISA